MHERQYSGTQAEEALELLRNAPEVSLEDLGEEESPEVASPASPLEGLAGGGEVLPGYPRYLVRGGHTLAARVEGRGENRSVVYWPLANFAAVITREVAATDGAEEERFFELEGVHASGRPLPRARVRASEFAGLGWVAREFGAEAIVSPGQGAKDHLRAAIQYLSEGRIARARVYRHLGWTRLDDGTWAYLHAGGALGPQGPVEGVEVELDPPLSAFALPEPPATPEEERALVQEVLALLEVAPDRIAVPTLLYALTAPLGRVPFVVYLAGPTGAQKTSWSMVLQGFWGWRDTLKPPAGFTSTANSLEAVAFLAKDALLVVDDYAPQSHPLKAKEMEALAQRLIRAQGNSVGRGRMRADGSLRPDKPPRGGLLMTGEDLPSGHSIRARGLFLEVERGSFHLGRLLEAQRKARQGVYARALAAWIRHLAQDPEGHREALEERVEELRGEWPGLAHARTPDALARLWATWELWRAYAAGLGLDLSPLDDRVRQALEEVGQAQNRVLKDADPVENFLDLLFGLLRGKRAHLVSREAPNEAPKPPDLWGWQEFEAAGGGDGPSFQVRPSGPQIGWVDPEGPEVYLEPQSAYAALARFAQEQGMPLPSPRTLWKLLGQRGVLVALEEGGETRYLVHRRIGGTKTRVAHIPAHALEGYLSEKTGDTGDRGKSSVPDGENPVPGKVGVPGNFRGQAAAPSWTGMVSPVATGDTTKTGDGLSAVQDAKTGGVPGVPGFSGEITPRANTEGGEEGRTPRKRREGWREL